MSPLSIAAIIVTVVMSLISFFLMRYDKQCAINRKRRVPEFVLYLSAACFGALGGTLAMYIFNHKTKHWDFKAFFPAMMIIQIVIVGFITYRWLI